MSFPLTLIFAGQLLVLVDVRASGVDVVPDPVGWAMTVYAALGLAPRTRLLVWAAVAAAGTAAVSMVDWLTPLRPPASVSTASGVVRVREDLLTWATVYELADTVVVVLVAVALRELAARAGDTHAVRSFRGAAAAVAGLAVLLHVLVSAVALGYVRGGLMVLLLAPALAWLGAYIWWMVLLWRHRRRPWAWPAGWQPSLLPAESVRH